MSWWYDKPKVDKRAAAAKAVAKLGKKGQALSPVKLENRTIARTFWGKAWCDNLESYRDFAHRLERGRTYVRGGYVIDLQVGAGRVNALVQGSSLYKIDITLTALSSAKWKAFRARAGGQVKGLLDLLQGKISPDLLADITRQGEGLFPSPKEIQFKCSCPDWASMCKHVAAALYGVGARLDTQPDLFFKLRGVDAADLFDQAARDLGGAPLAAASLADDALADIFGVEIEAAAPATVVKPAKPAGKAKTKAKAKPKAKPRAKPKAVPAPVKTPAKRGRPRGSKMV